MKHNKLVNLLLSVTVPYIVHAIILVLLHAGRSSIPLSSLVDYISAIVSCSFGTYFFVKVISNRSGPLESFLISFYVISTATALRKL